MTVARVASAESIRTDTSDPYTFSYAGGTPEGIAIAVVHGVSGTALASAVSYGGVPLALIVEATDTVTEPGNAQIWFLGSGIPTGTQTVSVDLTSASTADLHIVVWELSGTTDLEVIDSDEINENAANPVVTLQAGGRDKISLCAMYGGGAAPGGTLATGNTLDHTHDLGAFYSQTCYETTVDNADHTIGWSTLGTDDLAFVAIAVSEAVAAQTLDGTLFGKTPTFFTGVVTSVYALTGTLFSKTPTFFTGSVTTSNTLVGLLFGKTPTFPVGQIQQTQTLTGTLFSKTPGFFTGSVTAAYTLDGTLFVKTPTFFAGAVTTTVTVSGVLFSKTLSFPTGTVTTEYTLNGVLFGKAPSFFAGSVATSYLLTGTLFNKTATFPTGAITTSYQLDGNLYTKTPTFFAGTVTSLFTLSGVLFSKTPTFFTGTVSQPAGPQTLTGVLFAKAPAFPVGIVTQQAVLTGILFIKTPTFPVGIVTVIAVPLPPFDGTVTDDANNTAVASANRQGAIAAAGRTGTLS